MQPWLFQDGDDAKKRPLQQFFVSSAAKSSKTQDSQVSTELAEK